MILGIMNDPTSDLLSEILLAKEFGCDFFEVTVEPPRASRKEIIRERKEISEALASFRGKPVGHTAYYINFSSPFPRISEASIREIFDDLWVLSDLGVEKALVHLPYPVKREGYEERCLKALRRISSYGDDLGIKICVENPPFYTGFNWEEIYSVENLYIALDIGHAYLSGELEDLLYLLEEELVIHLHVHDNKGKGDDHLPIMAGNVPWEEIIPKVKKWYDGTVTIEDHSKSKELRKLSLKLFKELWEGSGDEGGDL